MPRPTTFLLHTLYVFTTDRWDLYAVVQSTLHEVWARKYSGALGNTIALFAFGLFRNLPLSRRLVASGEQRALMAKPLAAHHS